VQKISFKDLYSYATVPQSCDNQFIPHSIGADFDIDNINHKNTKYSETKKEIIRSILYSPQIIVNRIAWLNNDVFYDFYVNPSEAESLRNLMNSHRIVPALFSENSLDIESFENASNGFKQRENNKPFIQFLETLKNTDTRYTVIADNLLNAGALKAMSTGFDMFFGALNGDMAKTEIIDELKIKKDLRKEFYNHLEKLKNDYMLKGLDGKREILYEEWVLVDDTSALEMRISKKKKFAYETKIIIDLVYNHNLANVAKRYIFVPKGLPSPSMLPSHYQDDKNNEEIENSILKETLFYRLQNEKNIPDTAKLSLQDLVKIQSTKEWEDYINYQKDFMDNPKKWTRDGLKDYANLLSDLYAKIKIDYNDIPSYIAEVSIGITIKIGSMILEFVDDTKISSAIYGMIEEKLEKSAKNISISVIQYYYSIGKKKKLLDKFETITGEIELTKDNFKELCRVSNVDSSIEESNINAK